LPGGRDCLLGFVMNWGVSYMHKAAVHFEQVVNTILGHVRLRGGVSSTLNPADAALRSCGGKSICTLSES